MSVRTSDTDPIYVDWLDVAGPGRVGNMAKAFIAWNRNPQGGHRAPGDACRLGCEALEDGVHWSEAGGAKAGGCGSLMRAYPFGLLFADDLERAERWAVEHSKLTHRAERRHAGRHARLMGARP